MVDHLPRISLHSRPLPYLLFLLSIALMSVSFLDGVEGDLRYYYQVMQEVRRGVIPYKSRPFEYPPYFFVVAALPSVSTSWSWFFNAFVFEMLALDAWGKAALLAHGLRTSDASEARRDALLPFLTVAVMALCGQHYELKRFDLVPSTCVLVALLAFARGRIMSAGALLGFAIGAKAYPVVIMPALLVFAWRERRFARFASGIGAALAPLLALATVLPWWRFATFHSHRGLQAESIYASLVWLGRQLNVLRAAWKNMVGWMEVGGRLAQTIVPYARGIFILAVVLSVLLSVRYALRVHRVDIHAVAIAALGPLLAFIAFNLVLSPQYLIWLAGPAALLITTRLWRVSVAITVASALTLSFFPDPEYFSRQGISLFATIGLVLRNVTLIYAWVMAARALWQGGAAPSTQPVDTPAALIPRT